MQELRFAVTLTVKGPFLTQSTAPEGYGVDAPLARDTDGNYCIPGTLLKGLVRQSWEELKSAAESVNRPEAFAIEIDDWLGATTGNREEHPDASVAPHRARLRFDDLTAAPVSSTRTICRIAIDADRGSVANGAYQIIEAPFRAGEEVTFWGSIACSIRSQVDAPTVEHALTAGLRWMSSVGAERTVGFGEVVGVEVVRQEPEQPAFVTTKAPVATHGFNIEIRPDGPFCIAKRRANDNLFESEIVVPGSVIKGSIAETWARQFGAREVTPGMDRSRKELCEHFSQIRFTHALPSATKRRPSYPPLSLVKAGASGYFDVILCETPGLIGGRAPEFAVDWKDSKDVKEDYGWPPIKTQLRVRTAHDPRLRRAADEQLFGYEMVVPDRLSWFGRIDLSDVPQASRAECGAQLVSLIADGLRNFSKTKVTARAECSAAGWDAIPEWDGIGWAVTLQTPALLCDPSELTLPNGTRQIFEAYRAAWLDISGGTLELIRFFACQSLAGGYYLHRRFQDGKPYAPWLLTDPGSVFLLQPRDGQAEDAARSLERLTNRGLPLPAWARERYARDHESGDSWRNCPYIRHNGYGEIAVSLPAKSSRRPGALFLPIQEVSDAIQLP